MAFSSGDWPFVEARRTVPVKAGLAPGLFNPSGSISGRRYSTGIGVKLRPIYILIKARSHSDDEPGGITLKEAAVENWFRGISAPTSTVQRRLGPRGFSRVAGAEGPRARGAGSAPAPPVVLLRSTTATQPRRRCSMDTNAQGRRDGRDRSFDRCNRRISKLHQTTVGGQPG